MNPLLAKDLKNAGFPVMRRRSEHKIYELPGGEVGSINRWSNYEHENHVHNEIFEPTLSELIEACGQRFGSLTRSPHHTWYTTEVRGKDELEYELVLAGEYPAPEEAVAHLWLTLHSQDTHS
jgi:hypothetical protein